MKILLKSGYNISLLHIIDSISLWDEHVSDHNYNWFKSRFYISKKDREMLNKYASYRKKLGWEKESTLLNWGYNGYKGNKYKNILKVIEYFEFKRSRKGITLSYYIKKRQSKIDETTLKIAKKIKKKQLNNITRISPSKKHFKQISLYITPSFDISSYQAGANGNGILIELPSRIKDREIISVVFHELFHKVGNLTEYLNKFPDIKIRKTLRKKNSELLYSTKADIIDEIFAYTLTNHLINKEDPNTKIRLYKNIKLKKERNYLLSIWEGVKKLAPTIINYNKKKVNTKYVVNLMINDFRKA